LVVSAVTIFCVTPIVRVSTTGLSWDLGKTNLVLWGRFKLDSKVQGLHDARLNFAWVKPLIDGGLLSDKELHIFELLFLLLYNLVIITVHFQNLFLKGLLQILHF
jgi:hypothetical protein